MRRAPFWDRLRPMSHWDAAKTTSSPSLAYWKAGRGGPRVLLIMGFGMRGEIWQPQIAGLQNDHQLLFFDNRGVGQSARGFQRTWTMKDMAQDALRVMNEAGWSDAHLVGVSMGGMIAQELALMVPSRFRSLSLIATHEGTGWTLPPLKGIRHFLKANLQQGPGRVKALQSLLYPQAFLEECDAAALEERMQAQVGRPSPRPTLLGQLSAIARHRTGPRLHKLSMPTLIVKPKLDMLVPPSGSDRILKAMRHAKLLELPKAGHGAIFQEAVTINRALRDHFTDADATALAQQGTTVHA